jgi:acetyl esterase/lipase
MLRLPRVPAVALAGVLLALVGPAAAPAAAKPVQGPAGDAFYASPVPLPGATHGDLVWSRRLTGAAVVPGAARTDVVLYRSTGVSGAPTAVSGVVSIPKGRTPKGGWPVVTYAHGTTGIADQCAPSRDQAGTAVHAFNVYAFGLLQKWLKAGWAVVRTDYEGLGTTPDVHPYLIGSSEGRGVLDIVRAARQLNPKLSKTVLIAGHSQGGHAALFAAAMAKGYTPDLRVRGTVAFAPASHVDDQIPLTTVLTQPGGGLSGLVALIARGIAVADPSVDVAGLLSEQATALLGETDTKCVSELAQPDSFGGLAPAAIFHENPDFTAVAAALDREDPSHLKIPTPVLIPQGLSDTTVFPQFTAQLDRELRAAGGKITYKRYPGLTHAGVVVTAKPQNDATKWMAARLGPAVPQSGP